MSCRALEEVDVRLGCIWSGGWEKMQGRRERFRRPWPTQGPQGKQAWGRQRAAVVVNVRSVQRGWIPRHGSAKQETEDSPFLLWHSLCASPTETYPSSIPHREASYLLYQPLQILSMVSAYILWK